MGIKFTNFAVSQLAVGLTAGDTTLSVKGGHGARFPILSAGDFCYLVLESAAGAREIVKATARTADTFTVVRGQDDTTAQAWVADDSVSLRFIKAAIGDALGNVVPRTSTTGAAIIPSGTTAQRDPAPVYGAQRANSTNNKMEWFDGTGWVPMGGGATGGGNDAVFNVNSKTVTQSFAIPSGSNASTTGPLTINSGVVITIPTGSRLVIL